MSRFLPHKSIFIYIDFSCKTSVLVEMGHRTWQDDEFDQSIPNISPWAEVPGPLDTFRVNESGCSGNTCEERGIETRQGRSWRRCMASSYRSGLRSTHKETGSQGVGTQDCPDERDTGAGGLTPPHLLPIGWCSQDHRAPPRALE